MINGFEKVCVKMSEARPMEEKTEKVYQFLLANAGKHFRAKEIAEGCDFVRVYWNGTFDVIVQQATHPLTWLTKLGMIHRVEVEDEPIEISSWEYVDDADDGKPSEVVIDGVTYYRRETSYFGFPSRHPREIKKTIIPHHTEYFVD